VIQTKVRQPAMPRQLVSRPRVERLLAALVVRHRVVVVAATAGAGKTTAVARATAALDRPVAWLQVDRTDSAPGRLVIYLEAALARVLPELRGVALNALAAGVPHAEAAGLLAEAVAERPIVLVIDDLERLPENGQAWGVVEAVVRYAPAAMRLVLVSLRMWIASALGDDDGVIRAYQGCRRALAEIGTTPSRTTQDLLERLRG
jgi:ATP/maltotriose-dependent transcriptional regulator MalT